MKTKYFSKVENKYVFNVSLIFWHLFIVLSTLVVVASLAIFLWSIIPASQREVEKRPYPAKRQYPPAIKVELNELQLYTKKAKAPPVAPKQIHKATPTIQKPVEDTRGKGEYDSTLSTLKTLIPPSKYSWKGEGYWSYPNNDNRYWKYYKLEKYRHWNPTKLGVEAKLNRTYKRTNATNYPNKKLILGAYISVLKLLPEKKRLDALQNMINNVAYNNNSLNVNVCQSLTGIVSKMPKEGSISYINQLARFGKNNPKDGSRFIDYTATIIDKFDISKRTEIIDRLIIGYNNYFSQNLTMLKEATDLFLPLVAKIRAKNQSKAIIRYYAIFRNKNYTRDNSIAEIDNEYRQAKRAIDNQYKFDQSAAQVEYYSDKMTKVEYRLKALAGIGGGIVLIVLIAVVLVLFSIQRIVRKIEEKI